jgi:SAM-dependent methyltransferase
MDLNYEYFIEYIKKIPDYQKLKILDFGCGRGEIVGELIKQGVNICGVDTCYSREIPPEILASDLYRQGLIKIIKPGEALPFTDKSFDLIISNQVFEHLVDLPFAASELDRVLADGGQMYHHFPTRDAIWEGHIGIPFAHWLPPHSEIRHKYIAIMRVLGWGLYKKELGNYIHWLEDSVDRLDNLCFYRKYSEIEALFSAKYQIKHCEGDYVLFRLSKIKKFKIFNSIVFKNWYGYLFRHLAFTAIELKKK